jgi:hypothetical protein
MRHNIIKYALTNTSFWQINKDIARAFGLDSAVILTELVDKWIYLKCPYSFFHTMENIEEQTTLSRHKQDKAIKILIEAGFINYEVKGIPAKKHFIIYESQIANFLQTSFHDNLNTDYNNSANKNVNNSQTINNNTSNNNTSNINISSNEVFGEFTEADMELFPDKQPEEEDQRKVAPKESKFLFRNSKLYKMCDPENGNYTEFEKLFTSPEFQQIDLIYYFNSVNDWSEARTVKRTDRGWMSTIKQFIRSDSDKKKLKLKLEYQAPSQAFDVDAAKRFLNDDF